MKIKNKLTSIPSDVQYKRYVCFNKWEIEQRILYLIKKMKQLRDVLYFILFILKLKSLIFDK